MSVQRRRPRTPIVMRGAQQPAVLTVVACVVCLAGWASVGLAGFAFAAGGGSAPTIRGCYQKKGGNLRIIGANARCLRTERAIEWNQQGPPGAAEVAGSNGTDGTNGTNGVDGTARSYGHVAVDGTLTRAKNASVSTPSAGLYCITPAAEIDPSRTVLVLTPDFAGDVTTFGNGNDFQAVVEWDSSGLGCAAGEFAVRTGFRSQSSNTPVNLVNLTAGGEAFAFAIP